MSNPATERLIIAAGAAAYDQIATSRNPVRDDGGARLNFKLDSVSETFGGCSANITYNLAQLGAAHLLVACTGELDQDRFLAHCQRAGINTSALMVNAGENCSRALIITDPDGHQITGFYPGPEPATERWLAHLRQHVERCHIWVQSPYPTNLMLAGLEFASSLASPVLKIWNPGQYAEVLAGEELKALLALSDWIVVNRHELSIVEPHLGDQLAICTHGADPVEIHYPDGRIESIPVPRANIAGPTDPTGCGDAFIAGVVNHLAQHPAPLTPHVSAAVHAGMGTAAACLAQRGAQRHQLNGTRKA